MRMGRASRVMELSISVLSHAIFKSQACAPRDMRGAGRTFFIYI